jgi:hypothetical protein
MVGYSKDGRAIGVGDRVRLASGEEGIADMRDAYNRVVVDLGKGHFKHVPATSLTERMTISQNIFSDMPESEIRFDFPIRGEMAATLYIPDLHCPFHHQDAVAFLTELKRVYRPSVVVCLGDEIDAAAASTFAKNPEMPAAADELARAIDALRPVYKLFPRVKVCHSNHTLRPYKRAAEAGLPVSMVQPIAKVLKAPKGWEWGERWEVDGVLAFHGDGFTGKYAALTAAERFRQSIVMGHTHTYAGVMHSAAHNGCIFGLNAGCLIDGDSPAFAYAKHFAHRPVLGAGVIVDGVPQFIPM